MERPARRHHLLHGFVAVIGLAAPCAIAGPPLVVDDPVTLDRGQFELFTSFLYSRTESQNAYETPAELTIGLAKGWECSIHSAYDYHEDFTASPNTVNGILSVEIGTKVRLLTESESTPVSLAISGKLRLPTSSNSKFANQGKTTGGVFAILGRNVGDYSLNLNVGYGVGGAQNRDLVSDAWFFGLALQRIFQKKYTVFAEVYSTPQVNRFGDAVINADGGLLWDLSDRYRITLLMGRGFRPGGAAFIANLGLLLSFGPQTATTKLAK